MEGKNVAMLERLHVSGFHALGETLRIEFDDLMGGFHDAETAAEVFIEADLGNVKVAVGESDDILDLAAAPLVDGLVVVTDDTKVGAEVVEGTDETFLERIDILVFIDDEITNLPADLLAQLLVGLEFLNGLTDDHGVVEVAEIVQKLPILGNGFLNGGGNLVKVNVTFAEDADELLVEGRVFPAGEGAAFEEGSAGKAASDTVTVDEEALLDVVEDIVFEVAVEGWRLKKVEAVAVNGADEHVAETLVGTELFAAKTVDAVFELASGFFSESEGDDVGGVDSFGEDLDDAGGDDLSFTGTGTSDDLEVAVRGVDGLELGWGVVHGGLPLDTVTGGWYKIHYFVSWDGDQNVHFSL